MKMFHLIVIALGLTAATVNAQVDADSFFGTPGSGFKQGKNGGQSVDVNTLTEHHMPDFRPGQEGKFVRVWIPNLQAERPITTSAAPANARLHISQFDIHCAKPTNWNDANVVPISTPHTAPDGRYKVVFTDWTPVTPPQANSDVSA